MRSCLLGAILLAASFVVVPDTAIAYVPPASPVALVDNDFTVTVTFIGFDPCRKCAFKEAHRDLADYLELLADDLDEGCEIVGTSTNGDWNGIAYTLSAVILIACDCD